MNSFTEKKTFYIKLQILHDFTVRFPEANAGGFIEDWPFYAQNIKKVFYESYYQKIDTLWSDDIEELLVVLKLLPAKAGQKVASGVLPFNRAIDKFIVHTKVCVLIEVLRMIFILFEVLFQLIIFSRYQNPHKKNWKKTFIHELSLAVQQLKPQLIFTLRLKINWFPYVFFH